MIDLLDNTEIKYLKDVPEHLDTLAQWTYDAWGKYDPTLTLENVTESLKAKLNTDKLPLTMVAMNHDEPVGMVSLKPKIKLRGYTDRPIWLGSFWVPVKYRNHGVGSQLLDFAYEKARALGYKKISAFTSEPGAAVWYINNNWVQFSTDTYQDHPVTLLEFNL